MRTLFNCFVFATCITVAAFTSLALIAWSPITIPFVFIAWLTAGCYGVSS